MFERLAEQRKGLQVTAALALALGGTAAEAQQTQTFPGTEHFQYQVTVSDVAGMGEGSGIVIYYTNSAEISADGDITLKDVWCPEKDPNSGDKINALNGDESLTKAKLGCPDHAEEIILHDHSAIIVAQSSSQAPKQ